MDGFAAWANVAFCAATAQEDAAILVVLLNSGGVCVRDLGSREPVFFECDCQLGSDRQVFLCLFEAGNCQVVHGFLFFCLFDVSKIRQAFLSTQVFS